MHRIWAIPEVATTVLRLLDWPDQARMARVCRGLWEMAIPLIWEEIYDISVFTAFLGTTRGDSEGLDILTGNSSVAPHGGEPVHDRLASHARFVRTMEFTLDSKACQVVELLSNTPSFNESLVKLKSLDIDLNPQKDTIDGTILFRTFHTPIMTRIRICVNSVNLQTPAEPLRCFVQAITTSHLPVLQSLYIESAGSNSIDPFYLEEVLRVHQRLQEVEIITAECTPEMLEILKNFPVLRDLRLRVWHHLAEGSLPISPAKGNGFRHLVRLDIRCDLETIKQVLGSIESDQMEAFKMLVHWDGSNLDHRMGRMLGDLSQFRKLKEVELRLGITIVWEDIELVLACRGLTRFSLISSQLNWIPIDRTHLDAMVQAWPYLSHLAVTHAYHQPTTGTPLIKLADLIYVTDIRPSLRSLCISFDARRDGQEDVFALVTTPTESIPVSRCPLEVLDVGVSIKDCDEDAETELGQLFTSWWPTLRELKRARRSRLNWYPVIEFVRTAAGIPPSP